MYDAYAILYISLYLLNTRDRRYGMVFSGLDDNGSL